MRIAIDVRTISDHFPGIGRYTYSLVCLLARQIDRDELVLLANPAPANSRFNMQAAAAGSKVSIVHTAARPFSLREQVRLPFELKALKSEVTHFPYSVFPFAAPHPIVVSIHDIIPLRLPQYFSLRHRILYRVSLYLALRSAGSVICLSNATLSDLNSVFRADSSRIYVVPAGIGEPFHPCSDDEVERVRAQYGLSAPYILYAGSNKPHKNLVSLIDAYARLRKAPLLALAGEEDPRYTEVRRRVEALGLTGRVRFLEAVSEQDLPGLYSGALIFIFPSLYEGFGFPPLEAMACGLPVACSDIPSLRETSGGAALLFDPEKPDSIADAIERLLDDDRLRSDLRSRGLRRSAELSWDRAAQQTLEIYRRTARR
ncbi:MAG: glycosyltransferase family 4 protein [Acidobacteria bacterium]|nr:glycosyltransferase family 4 protein [Acidobacteriota bacterium]